MNEIHYDENVFVIYECDQYDESCSKKATVKVTTATFNELKINYSNLKISSLLGRID